MVDHLDRLLTFGELFPQLEAFYRQRGTRPGEVERLSMRAARVGAWKSEGLSEVQIAAFMGEPLRSVERDVATLKEMFEPRVSFVAGSGVSSESIEVR